MPRKQPHRVHLQRFSTWVVYRIVEQSSVVNDNSVILDRVPRDSFQFLNYRRYLSTQRRIPSGIVPVKPQYAFSLDPLKHKGQLLGTIALNQMYVWNSCESFHTTAVQSRIQLDRVQSVEVPGHGGNHVAVPRARFNEYPRARLPLSPKQRSLFYRMGRRDRTAQ